jgi:hypothetical protein
MTEHKHLWRTKWKDIDGHTSYMTGMMCECGAVMDNTDIEDILNKPMAEDGMNDLYQVLGYISQHTNCRETEICVALRMNIHDAWKAIQELQAQGLIESMGYASHVQEWHVTKPLSMAEIGRMYAERKTP